MSKVQMPMNLKLRCHRTPEIFFWGLMDGNKNPIYLPRWWFLREGSRFLGYVVFGRGCRQLLVGGGLKHFFIFTLICGKIRGR